MRLGPFLLLTRGLLRHRRGRRGDRRRDLLGHPGRARRDHRRRSTPSRTRALGEREMASHGDDEQDALRDGREGGLPKAHVIGDDETALGDTPEVHAEISPHDFPKGAPERQAAEQMAEEEAGEGTRGARGSERARGSRPASVAHPRRDSLRAWPSARSSSTSSARWSTGARASPGRSPPRGRRGPLRAGRRLARALRAGARRVQRGRAPGRRRSTSCTARRSTSCSPRAASTLPADARGAARARVARAGPVARRPRGPRAPAARPRHRDAVQRARRAARRPRPPRRPALRRNPVRASSRARTSPRPRRTSPPRGCSTSHPASSCSSPAIRGTSRAPAAPGCGRRSSTGRSSTARDRPPAAIPRPTCPSASLPELAAALAG